MSTMITINVNGQNIYDRKHPKEILDDVKLINYFDITDLEKTRKAIADLPDTYSKIRLIGIYNAIAFNLKFQVSLKKSDGARLVLFNDIEEAIDIMTSIKLDINGNCDLANFKAQILKDINDNDEIFIKTMEKYEKAVIISHLVNEANDNEDFWI